MDGTSGVRFTLGRDALIIVAGAIAPSTADIRHAFDEVRQAGPRTVRVEIDLDDIDDAQLDVIGGGVAGLTDAGVATEIWVVRRDLQTRLLGDPRLVDVRLFGA